MGLSDAARYFFFRKCVCSSLNISARFEEGLYCRFFSTARIEMFEIQLRHITFSLPIVKLRKLGVAIRLRKAGRKSWLTCSCDCYFTNKEINKKILICIANEKEPRKSDHLLLIELRRLSLLKQTLFNQGQRLFFYPGRHVFSYRYFMFVTVLITY